MGRNKQIKAKLMANSLSSAWLLEQLYRYGIETDKFRLCKILSGTLRGSHADKVLNACEKILDDYEKKFVNA